VRASLLTEQDQLRRDIEMLQEAIRAHRIILASPQRPDERAAISAGLADLTEALKRLLDQSKPIHKP
jgi:hypothetical protein